MERQSCGIDIIRAYELYWLNTQGKPQIAMLELQQEPTAPGLDTWKLKKFLESLNARSFINIDALKLELNNYQAIAKINVISQTNFDAVTVFEAAKLPAAFSKLQTFGVRFICPQTGQPFIGRVNVCLAQENKIPDILLQQLLTNYRNNNFEPRAFVDIVYAALEKLITNHFVLSIHLNRRGGISLQFIRSNCLLALQPFILRSVLE